MGLAENGVIPADRLTPGQVRDGLMIRAGETVCCVRSTLVDGQHGYLLYDMHGRRIATPAQSAAELIERARAVAGISTAASSPPRPAYARPVL